MKQKSMKLPGKKITCTKTQAWMHFEEHCSKIDHVSHNLYASFSLKPNIKISVVLICILTDDFHHNLFI